MHLGADDFSIDTLRDLSRLADMHSDHGRRLEALKISAELLRRQESLAAFDDRWLPWLASALNDHATHLHKAGWVEEALASCRRALEIRRRLCDENPGEVARHLDVASSLCSVANRLLALGRSAETETSLQEALGIFHLVQQANPTDFNVAYRMAVAMAGASFSAADWGLRFEAEKYARISVEALDAIPGDHRAPDHDVRLTRSLSALGTSLFVNGKLADAAAVLDRNISLREGLAKSRPEVHGPLLQEHLDKRDELARLLEQGE